MTCKWVAGYSEVAPLPVPVPLEKTLRNYFLFNFDPAVTVKGSQCKAKRLLSNSNHKSCCFNECLRLYYTFHNIIYFGWEITFALVLCFQHLHHITSFEGNRHDLLSPTHDFALVLSTQRTQRSNDCTCALWQKICYRKHGESMWDFSRSF